MPFNDCDSVCSMSLTVVCAVRSVCSTMRFYPITLWRRACIAAGVGAAAAAMAKWQAEPDLVLHNGAIWTVGARLPEVEAIAISGGRITAVGTSAEILALAGARTRRFDL